ncbi:hypothetical protein INT43_004709 [Umbelopsis isabellina]|uniref:Uncharacterized protein n=1 Tax=Mortierella isabellina TaxID=91625 RepID=A0A8H7PGM1_MORIS|nr:hypothetical protein INT43_004709 [Umbelopsis isabellina]
MRLSNVTLSIISLFIVNTRARVVNCTSDAEIYPAGINRSQCYQNYLKRLVVFGDSWTENGDGPLTQASYLQDGFLGRAVNGPTWAEYLTVENGIDLYDFAVAGATANNTNVPRGIPDVQQQVQQYLTYTGNASLPSASTLYAIWIGVNDIHDIYTNNNASDQRAAKVEIAAESVLNAVNTLYQKSKARRFLLPATPPIGYLPILTNGSSSAHHQPADELAKSFNHRVKHYLAEFRKEHQDAEIQTFNSYSYIMDIIKDPTEYGLKYSIEPCTNLVND